MGRIRMKLAIRKELTSGISLMVISAMLWFMVPFHIPDTGGVNNAQLFPRMVIVAMFVLASIMTVSVLIKKNDEILELDLKKELKIIIFILGLFVYVFLLDKIGFIPSAVLIGFMTLFYYKTSRKLYIYMTGFIICVYVLFTYALGVQLPSAW